MNLANSCIIVGDLRTKTRTSISGKICCVKSGSQILYVIEQLSSLFSKDKLKQGTDIHQTHDPPSPRMSWENCRTAPSQQLPPVFFPTGFPRLGARNYTRLGLHSRNCGDFCCDFRGVCVSLWTPARACSWFPVLPLCW